METRRDDLLRLGRERPSWALKWKEIQRFKEFLKKRESLGRLVTPHTIIDYLTERSFTQGKNGYAAYNTINTIKNRIATYLDSKGYTSKNPCKQPLVDVWEAGYALVLTLSEKPHEILEKKNN